MQQFEYRVVPAPRRGEKTRAARTTPDRFAHALTSLMNDLARDGWEYLRADTLPCEERVGLTGRTTTFQNMLIFRRTLSQPEPSLLLPHLRPAAAEPAPQPPARPPVPVTAASAPSRPDLRPAERVMAEYASLPPRPPARTLTAAAPVGEAPRIALVASLPAGVPAIGPAAGNGLGKL